MTQLARSAVYIALGAAGGYLVLIYVAPLFTPFILALFLAFFIEPTVDFLQEKTRLPRGAAVGLAMFVIFGGFGLIVTLALTRLIIELVHLTEFLPEYIIHIKAVVFSLQKQVVHYYLALPADVLDFVNERIASTDYSLDAILKRAQVVTTKTLNLLLQLVSSVPILVILIVISGIATYFMSKDKRVIISYWLRVAPEPWGQKSLDITREILQAIISYLRAQTVLISITLVLSILGLYIVGAPYALLMGLIVGVADVIPILGPSSIYLPWIAWEFISGDNVFAIKLAVLYALVLIIRQVLETKIISSSIGLHPLATLMSMYVGLQLMGAVGVVAGPLLVITIKAFASAGVIGWKKN